MDISLYKTITFPSTIYVALVLVYLKGAIKKKKIKPEEGLYTNLSIPP